MRARPARAINAIPNGVWTEVFEHLDEASLRRARTVCRKWAKIANEVIWCQPAGQMLDELLPYSSDFFLPAVHTLVLRRPQDFTLRMRFPNLRHLVIDNIAFKASGTASLADVVQRFCEPPRPSRVTIYDSIASRRLEFRHWGLEGDWLGVGDVAFLAQRPGLKFLSVTPSLLHPMGHAAEYARRVGPEPFRHLRLLVTRVWSFSAAGLLRLVPDIEVLVLEVPNDDHLDGCVLHAVATVLRSDSSNSKSDSNSSGSGTRLRELTITYGSRFAVRDRDVAALARFRQLRVLELRGSREGEELRPLVAGWSTLRPLLAGGLPHLVRLWLPPPREWLPPDALSLIGKHCPLLHYVRLPTMWDIGSLRDINGTGAVFPRLRTFVVDSVGAPLLYEAESTCRARADALVELLRTHAPALWTLRMNSPSLLDVYVFEAFQFELDKEIDEDPWLVCKANLVEGEWY